MWICKKRWWMRQSALYKADPSWYKIRHNLQKTRKEFWKEIPNLLLKR